MINFVVFLPKKILLPIQSSHHLIAPLKNVPFELAAKELRSNYKV